MRASQKGMKLNDIRYFRQPRPYIRKRITKMRLFPNSSGIHSNAVSSPKNERNRRSIRSPNSKRSRDRCVTLDRDQRSREMARLSYTTSDFDLSKDGAGNNRDTFAETDPEIEIVVVLPVIDDAEKTALKLNKKRSGVEEDSIKRIEERARNAIEIEKPEVSKHTRRGHDKSDNRSSYDSSTGSEKGAFWSRYESIRKILDFFGNLLGRRVTVNRAKQPLGTNAERQRVGTNSQNDRANNETTDSAKRRKSRRSSKRKTRTGKKYFTIDSRAALLEREMANRKLEEENRRYKMLLNDKLRTRRMSNPLH